MKTLFVHERFGTWSAAESNVLATAGELKRRGHHVGVLHGPGTGKGESAWADTFATCFPLTSANRSAAVKRALESFQPDLIYVNKLADLEALEKLSAAGVPRVRMVHDHDLGCVRGHKCLSLTRRICTRALSPFSMFPSGGIVVRNYSAVFPAKWINHAAKKIELDLYRRFHRLIVQSHYLRAELVRNGFAAEKIERHVPVPPAGEPLFRSTFSDRNLIVFVGQIVRGKGLDVLLESLARVRVPFELIVVGDGSYRPFCEDLSHALELAGRIHFKGFVPAEQLTDYYRQCSLVVMSSLWPEPFGMVGIEAMRYGLPVVAFDAGAVREWLIDGRNGYLVPWLDRDAYAARVEQLLADKPHAREMGERGAQMISDHYDFSKYVAGLEDLFTRVIAEAQGKVAA
jgi:glycosyltransferase involved in cell wall biosynthesis